MQAILSIIDFGQRQLTSSIEIPDNVMVGAGIHLILQKDDGSPIRVPIEAIDVDPKSRNVILRIQKNFEYTEELINNKNYEWFETKYT